MKAWYTLHIETEETPDEKDFLACLSNTDNAWSVVIPELAKLVRIYKVLPHHMADCERDFLTIKIIKMDIRNQELSGRGYAEFINEGKSSGASSCSVSLWESSQTMGE